MVGYHPLSTNIYHGEVWGKFTDGYKKHLMRRAQWLVPIPNVALY